MGGLSPYSGVETIGRRLLAGEDEARPGRRWIWIALAAILLAGVLAVWIERKPIARDFIDKALTKRGVAASYDLKRIGLHTERLEHVRIGDPNAPDLTADWVEVDIAPTFGLPKVTAVRAGGVRLRGRVENGQLKLGAVDKLMGPPTGQPFRLPDLRVTLSDARLALATPVGPVDLRLDGQGKLSDGFAGQLRAAAPHLDFATCAADWVAASTSVRVTGGRPHLSGPVQAAQVVCGTAALQKVQANADATLAPRLDGWTGLVNFASGAVTMPGWHAAGARGQVDFAGDAKRTGGTMRLAGLGVAGPPGSAARVELAGHYEIGTRAAETVPGTAAGPKALAVGFTGTVSASRVATQRALRQKVASLAKSAAGTPLAPLAERIAGTIEKALSSADIHANIAVSQVGREGTLRVETVTAEGGGATLRFEGGEGIRTIWPGKGLWQIDGRLALSGGGLPQTVIALQQAAPGAALTALARIAPVEAGGARLALAPVRYDNGRFSTRVDLSGPIGDGRVEGLSLPVSGRWTAAGPVLDPGCAPLSFRALSLAGLTLDPATLRLCAAGQALRLVEPRLSGKLGSSRVTLAARGAALDRSGFHVEGLAARLGSADLVSRLDITRLTGTGTGGTFAGLSGQIGKVPLLVSESEGKWRLAGGALIVTGSVRVADKADPPRFYPLVAHDLALSIAHGQLEATATLHEPKSGAEVTAVRIAHDFGAGSGHALLDVPGLTFGPALQPEAVTRLTVGVVANVKGTLSGRGEIAWNAEGVTSSGVFRTDRLDFAAAFGPVTGLAGKIRFSDLLGLVTPPGQRATVATVNPGIVVENGVVTYQLRPDLHIAVEGARWPFAGGELILEPTVLDFSQQAPRHLTFRLVGFEAARFIEQLEFKNIAATGTFDGTLPMIFDQDGGRIENGALTSRAPGGTLAYVGEVSNADLGTWGKLAFDALKSIRYSRLSIDLNGPLAGEMVTQVKFTGVNQGTASAASEPGWFRQLIGLPFRFNIEIRAPFRGLIDSAKTFVDPSGLIRQSLPPGLDANQAAPVQPQESGKKQ